MRAGLRTWLRPIGHLVRKEFRQIRRDPAMLRVAFITPIIQLFVLAYAANTDLRDAKVAVLDEDRRRPGRRMVEAVQETDVFSPGPAASNVAELEEALVCGKADVALHIPRGMQLDVMEGRPAVVAVLVDGQNSGLAGRAAGYVLAIQRREISRAANETGLPPAPPGPRIETVTRFFYNPELRSRYHMVPGIVAVLVTVVSAFLSSMALVREKETGTFEQLIVSPLSPAQIIAGKTLPFAILAFGQLAFATTVAVLWFRLPLRGSIPLLALGAAVYLLVTLGIGLLVSTMSSTQQQAMLSTWFFLVFMLLMSGFFFPIENMPGWAQWITRVNPMRYFMTVMRGIFLKGSGFADLWREFAALAVIGGGVFGTAVARFSKRVG